MRDDEDDDQPQRKTKRVGEAEKTYEGRWSRLRSPVMQRTARQLRVSMQPGHGGTYELVVVSHRPSVVCEQEGTHARSARRPRRTQEDDRSSGEGRTDKLDGVCHLVQVSQPLRRPSVLNLGRVRGRARKTYDQPPSAQEGRRPAKDIRVAETHMSAAPIQRAWREMGRK